MTFKHLLKYCALVVLLCRAGIAADRSAEVDSLFASDRKAPGAAVLIIEDGKILHEKGYGYADLQQSIAIGPHTVFDLASMSKQFTAMAILILEERGQLRLDDPVSRYIIGFPPYAKHITIRNLLNHTSGLPDYEQLFQKTGRIETDYPRAPDPQDNSWEPTTRDTLKLLVQQETLLFPSGTIFSYSDSGYVVLAEIIERVSGVKYGDFLKKNIFDRLGMQDTVVYDERKPKIRNRAISYESWLGFYRDIDYTPLNEIYGDGNVNSSIADLYLWDRELYANQLVPASTLQQAFTPGTLNNKQQIPYGFGWWISKYGPDTLLYHTGSWVGFRSMIGRIPQKHFSAVVLANCTCVEVEQQVQKILQIYVGK